MEGGPLEQVQTTCTSLRELLQDNKVSTGSEEKRWKALMLLTKLKGQLRQTYLDADERKEQVQEKKDVVERHQLQLQNLLYEKDHLLREIRRCHGFSTKEMDKIEFEDARQPIEVDEAAHRRLLDQLTNELKARKDMRVQYQKLQEDVLAADSSSAKKQAFLDNLRSEIASIEEASKPLQKYMSIPATDTLTLQRSANKLPAPLYSLYCELEGYQLASKSAIKLSIVDARGLNHASTGRKRHFPPALSAATNPSPKRAKAMSRSPSANPEKTEERAPSRSPSSRRSKTIEEGEEKASPVNTQEDVTSEVVQETPKEDVTEIQSVEVWEPSPKALKMKLPLTLDDALDTTKKQEHSFTLIFEFFPNVRIVTVNVLPSGSQKDELPRRNMLMNLFPDDTGDVIPRLDANYELLDDGELEFPSDALPRPYYWTQWICGLYPMKRLKHNEDARRPEPSVRNVMSQLVDRLTAQVHLHAHLKHLSQSASSDRPSRSDPILVHPQAVSFFPSASDAKLDQWKEVTHQSEQSPFKLSDGHRLELATTGCRLFRAVFKNDHATVSATVEVSCEYPARAPRFLFQPKKATLVGDSERRPAFENALKDVEVEVNSHYDELVTKESEHFVLMHQMRKVQTCLDVLTKATEEELSGNALGFGRDRRGKDRRRPIVTNAGSNTMEHR